VPVFTIVTARCCPTTAKREGVYNRGGSSGGRGAFDLLPTDTPWRSATVAIQHRPIPASGFNP